MPSALSPDIAKHLAALYGPDRLPVLASQVQTLLEGYSRPSPASPRNTLPLTREDAVLITYADQIRDGQRPPLRVLGEFCRRRLAGQVSAIHLLPFFPSTSDDGFAVVDYLQVDPAFGSWEDLQRIGKDFDLMFDAVLNHLSSRSHWFEEDRKGNPEFRDFFVSVTGSHDLSGVVRPRALPLLTEFTCSSGPRRFWTTFSADQVDLNYANPAVLLAVLKVLLEYVARGARLIRLDAIGFLWKEIGTSCIHRPQTHRLVQLMRAVLDEVAPETLLITETNVPHADNVAYFGNGRDEAQLVYNFALPPLVLHAYTTGNAQPLSRWVHSLSLPSSQVTFFNFLASHDGIGLNPARGLLREEEIDDLANGVLQRGGLLSYKHLSDGSRSPYELNINFFDALTDPGSGENLEPALTRFLGAHAILLSMPGLPGLYFHSLLGSRGDPEAARASGIPRRINRRKLQRSELETELDNPASLRYRVLHGLGRLLRARRQHPAFEPAAPFQSLPTDGRSFVLRRGSPAAGESVLCLHNTSADSLEFTCRVEGMESVLVASPGVRVDSRRVTLGAWEMAWIKELAEP